MKIISITPFTNKSDSNCSQLRITAKIEKKKIKPLLFKLFFNCRKFRPHSMKQNRQMPYPTRKANQVDFQVYASFIDFAPIVVLTFGFIKKVYTLAEYQIKIEFTIKKQQLCQNSFLVFLRFFMVCLPYT